MHLVEIRPDREVAWNRRFIVTWRNAAFALLVRTVRAYLDFQCGIDKHLPCGILPHKLNATIDILNKHRLTVTLRNCPWQTKEDPHLLRKPFRRTLLMSPTPPEDDHPRWQFFSGSHQEKKPARLYSAALLNPLAAPKKRQLAFAAIEMIRRYCYLSTVSFCRFYSIHPLPSCLVHCLAVT